MARKDFREHPVLEFLNNLWGLASVTGGSMTFWSGSGSGSADPCLLLMDVVDADRDPPIFVIDLQDSNKKLR
jgi:hypothetical protein